MLLEHLQIANTTSVSLLCTQTAYKNILIQFSQILRIKQLLDNE